MALYFTFTVSEKEIQEKWAEQTSLENWINMYEKLSESFSSWDIDLKLAEFIVNRVKTDYIDKYREDDIPYVLLPLLTQANNSHLKKQNDKNKNITIDDVSGVAEFTAIKKLREYESIDYEDAINLFCDGYYMNKEVNCAEVSLSEIDSEVLINELKNRI